MYNIYKWLMALVFFYWVMINPLFGREWHLLTMIKLHYSATYIFFTDLLFWIGLTVFWLWLCFIVFRWQKLLADSDQRKQTLLRLQDQYRQIEDLYLAFAKKASAFNSWFENAEEDLTDPVRCNSVEEIRVSTLLLPC